MSIHYYHPRYLLSLLIVKTIVIVFILSDRQLLPTKSKIRFILNLKVFLNLLFIEYNLKYFRNGSKYFDY